jgi:hypothetical protein
MTIPVCSPFQLNEFKGWLMFPTPDLTSDNKEAEIIVGENVPLFLKSQIQHDAICFQHIERKTLALPWD